MRNGMAAVAAALVMGAFGLLQESPMPRMEPAEFAAPPPKAYISAAPGRSRPAMKFAFDDDCRGVFISARRTATPAWDKAQGISFWVKGDGSNHLGGIEFVYDGDYATRYACSFPIDGTEWRHVVVPWRDLIPELGKTSMPVDAVSGAAPSKLGPVEFGKWWYWGDYSAHSYTVEDLRLETSIPADTRDYRPAGKPLARTLAKLKAGHRITVVTMGDSLTDLHHWTNREHNWPALLKSALKNTYGVDAYVVNPAMGGTELRQNLIVMPRWVHDCPRPDLVTILFGFNDWSAGMRGPAFLAAQRDAVDRVRRATNCQADVLILTSCPTLADAEALSEMAQACREAARGKNAGIGDVYAAFQAVPSADRPSLYATDRAHLSLDGQRLIARTVMESLSRAGGPVSPGK